MDLVDDYGGTIMRPSDLASAVDSRCSMEISKGRALSMQDFLAADGGLQTSSHRSVKTEPLFEEHSAARMEAESSNDSMPSSSGSQKETPSQEGAGLASLLIGTKKADPNDLSIALAGMSATMDRIVKEAEENQRRKSAAKKKESQMNQILSKLEGSTTLQTKNPNETRTATPLAKHAATNLEPGISMSLVNEDLWREFYDVGTEMFARESSRKMFPRFELSVRGLNPKGVYAIVLSMRLIGPFRYISTEKRWVSSPYRSDSVAEWSNAVLHHDQCAKGEHWMKQTVSFDRIKLMNRTPTGISDQEVCIASLHKYQPVFQVLRLDLAKPSIVFCYEPEVTQFVGVTQYHNRAISALKIKHNPIAKKMHEGAARKRSLASMVVYQSPSFTQVTSASPASSEDASSRDAPQPVVVSAQDYTAVLELLGSILAEKTAPTLLPLDDSPTAFV